MAGICCGVAYSSPALGFTRVHRIHCCSGSGSSRSTPRLVKLVVTGVTELLRLYFTPKQDTLRLETVGNTQKDDVSALSVDDVINSLKGDYENDYFVTGVFSSAIYAEDCIFEDPTISFRGKDLYARNLKLLVPFFDQPSIGLKKIEKGINSEMKYVLAKWELRMVLPIFENEKNLVTCAHSRTYLKLPWRPLISIDGRTIYELDDKFKIVRHAEEWDVSALEAIGQIFNPSSGRSIN